MNFNWLSTDFEKAEKGKESITGIQRGCKDTKEFTKIKKILFHVLMPAKLC
jgi:hypothetical protein